MVSYLDLYDLSTLVAYYKQVPMLWSAQNFNSNEPKLTTHRAMDAFHMVLIIHAVHYNLVKQIPFIYIVWYVMTHLGLNIVHEYLTPSYRSMRVSHTVLVICSFSDAVFFAGTIGCRRK